MADHHDDGPTDIAGPQSPVEVHLSRPCYPTGSVVVGTILLAKESVFVAAQVCVVLNCRIDPRWHTPSVYQHKYGVKVSIGEKQSDWCPVWVTNTVDLMSLPQRQSGSWSEVRPNKPLQLPPDNPERYFTEEDMVKLKSTHTTENGDAGDAKDENDTATPAEENLKQHAAFTFRAQIPMHLPPTVSLTCCRYSYMVLVEATTVEGEVVRRTVPFTVSSHNTSYHNGSININGQGSLSHGYCCAMAHSSGLPCYITADDIHTPQGQTTIRRALRTHDVKTLRVADTLGQPCCIVTAFDSSVMVPGATLRLQFDALSPWCRQVSACLEGHETAIRQYNGSKNHKTRTHLFDAAHALVDPGYTDSVPLSLQLPLDCPVTVTTNLVQVIMTCRVDISIANKNGSSFTNLRLDLPVTVVHQLNAVQEEDEEEEEATSNMMEELLSFELAEEEVVETTPGFESKDILKDLKILSLFMVEKFGLVKEDAENSSS